MLKNKLLIGLLCWFAYSTCQAQITLDNTYSITNSYQDMQPVLLESAGTKYAIFDQGNLELKLYNLDHSIYKTITVNTPSDLYDPVAFPHFNAAYFYYVKEGLFDTDNEVEFMLHYQACLTSGCSTTVTAIAIINEDGSVLFQQDDTGIKGTSTYYLQHTNTPSSIINASDGTSKMILKNTVGPNIYVYNLPGTLMCDPCGGTTGARYTEANSGVVLKQNAPNPSTTYTVVGYELPEEADRGTLKIYNTSGIELKSYQVDKSFDHLQISTQDLPAGTYYYTIQTNIGQVQSKKMIVVK
ncbi:T9SS type A sorting domain-containing protein [Aureispira anguillae]|uniref:T9SS type A sorting domain-containing protein n=1 Tax=Aureispira anguillae TaxID=2864201 RepID=A0A915YBS6_9BACT|nr:T9SS type A sorting domain-containing protein [Aureispira anguillae]BDS10159.1 T9SS type A sorting domain-containing protein [Aureispira anguillae]